MNKGVYYRLTFVIVSFFLLVVVYFSINPKGKDYFPKCLLYQTTGLYCPGCGSQRTIHHLLHFNILHALKYNPLLVISLPFLIFIFSFQLYKFIFQKDIQLKWAYNNRWVWLIFIIVLLYGILRNLSFYPFVLLAPSGE